MPSCASETTGAPSIPSTSTRRCRKDRGCFSTLPDLWRSWFPNTDDSIEFQCQGPNTQSVLASETPNASSATTQVVQDNSPTSLSSMSSRSQKNNEQGEQTRWSIVHGSTTCLTKPFEREVALYHRPQCKDRLYRAVEAFGSCMRKGIDALSQLQAGQDEEPALSCNEFALGPPRFLNSVDFASNGTLSLVTMRVEQEFVRRTVRQDDDEPLQWHWFTKQWSVMMFNSSDIEALFNSIEVGREVSVSTSLISKNDPLNHALRELSITSARNALESLE